MDIQAGDYVLVNVAPFIGSARPSKDSVPCKVIEVEGTRIRVCTDYPYQQVHLWVQSAWIDEKLEPANSLGDASLA
jgi:hypothetical protein